MTVTRRVPAQRSEEAAAAESWSTVQRAQAGDQSAVAELYRLYQPTVIRFIYFRTSDPTLAEDLSSDVWVRALKALPTFQWQGKNVGAWLVTIARNLIADHFKCSRTRLESTTADMLDADREDHDRWGSPERAVLDYLDNRDLLAAVKQLSEDQRECIVFRFICGYSTSETAAAMGRDYTAIKSLQWRATRSLARAMAGAS